MRFLAAALAAAAAFAGGVALARSRGGGGKWTAKDAEKPFFVYRVKPGDTLSEISKVFFGNASYWKVLGAKAVRPEDLRVGEELRVPCVWVTLKPGDTLSSLAAQHLGSAEAWRRIWCANDQVAKPDQLQVGWVIAVPKLPSEQELRKVFGAPEAAKAQAEAARTAVGGELEELG